MTSIAPDSESSLRVCARQAIRFGRIPAERPPSMWGGNGSGASCAVCGHAVEPAETEMELEYPAPGAVRVFHLHVRCCAAWEAERRDALRDQHSQRTATLPAGASGGNIARRDRDIAHGSAIAK